MKRLLFLSLGLLLFVLSAPSRASAQAVGEIWGAIVDQSGAAVPQAQITAREEATNISHTTVATGTGNYSFTSLPIGTYTVSITMSGFKTGTIAGVTVEVNQQREVNFTLVVAGNVQAVSVTANPPLINTTTGSLGGVVNTQQVETLPLNGRDITNLITLQPGTSNDPNGAGHDLTGGFTASNGTRGTSVASYLDSADTSEEHFGGPSMTNFNLDAIAEFQVLQNNYSAEYGRGGGMIVLMASKTGTNQFHGSLFEFVRNSAMDSRSFFATGVPPLQRNEFGGTVGGPIIKNKTFFFFDYAALRQLSGTPSFLLFPTAANRQGLVSITGANGQPDQLEVPLNSNAQTVLNEYPLPNDPTGPYGPNTFYNALKTPISLTQYSGRIDHRFSEKDSIFGRFTYDNQSNPIQHPERVVFNRDWGKPEFWNIRNLTVSETHIFSPTLLNEVQLTWDRDITSSVSNPPQLVSSISTSDGTLAAYGPFAGGWSGDPDSGSLRDTIHWVKGRHRISTGITYYDVNTPETGSSLSANYGNYEFTPGQPIPVAVPSASGLNNLPAGSPSPSGLVSVMLGIPNSYSRTLAFPGFGPQGGAIYEMKNWNLATWLQDDIALTQKLSFNIGLRYEYNSVPYEEHNRLTGIVDDPKLDGGSVYRAMVVNPSPVYQPDYHGWGPRVGFAYRLNDKTVLRGGGAIYTLQPIVQATDQEGAIFPFASYGNTLNPVFQLTPAPITNVPVLTDLNGNTLPPNNNTNLIRPNTPMNLTAAAAYFGAPIELNAMSMGYRNGYGENANLTVERQLPGDMALSVAYVLSNGVKLPGGEFPNAYTNALPQYTPYTDAYPGIGEFQLEDSHEHSTYNAVQIRVRKTSDKYGLAFQASYTWSKELDNGDTIYNGPEDSVVVQQNPFCWRCDKGPGTIDFPQNFVMSFIYELPLNRLTSLPARLTNGWQVGGIPRVISGSPFSVTGPYPVAAYGTDTYYGTVATRPDMVGAATLNSPSNYNSTLGYFVPAVVADGTNLGQQVFATPGGVSTGFQSHPGDLGRATFRYPATTNVDFSLLKDTKIREDITFQFRAEFFNIFNSHYFNGMGTTLGVPGFGLFNSTTPGRIIQFGARLIF